MFMECGESHVHFRNRSLSDGACNRLIYWYDSTAKPDRLNDGYFQSGGSADLEWFSGEVADLAILLNEERNYFEIIYISLFPLPPSSSGRRRLFRPHLNFINRISLPNALIFGTFKTPETKFYSNIMIILW